MAGERERRIGGGIQERGQDEAAGELITAEPLSG